MAFTIFFFQLIIKKRIFICLKFNGIPLKTEEEIYNNLKKIPQVIWIAKTQGEWDSLISCTVNNIQEFDQIKDKILSLTNPYISNKSISTLLQNKP